MSSPLSQTIYIAGDTHGDFRPLIRWASRPPSITPEILIHVGDVGIGFKNWEEGARLLAGACEATGKNVFLQRGNHDDPKPFWDNLQIGRVTLLDDCSLIDFLHKGEKQRILTVGGGVSIDRVWRRQQERKNGVKIYWPDEVFSLEKLPETLVLNGEEQIHHIITHTGKAEWCGLSMKNGVLDGWAKHDGLLLGDIAEERRLLSKLLFDVTDACPEPPRTWTFGHFHMRTVAQQDGIIFTCVNINQISKLIPDENDSDDDG